MQTGYEELIEKHVNSLEWLRKELLQMDSLIKPIMGIKDWDDSCCINFHGKKLVVSVDGPYTKRLVMKSALIHASTDVVVKGAKPLFALDTLIGNEEDIKEMVKSLKKQALEMKIPILGGNTMRGEDAKLRCSLVVVGELIIKEPIRDNGAKKGDILAILGEPIWGEQKERIKKAKKLFKTWYEILNFGIKVHAAKDVTKGGLISTLYEISEKSKVRYKINKPIIPFSLTRNLDNFLLALEGEEYEKILKISKKNKCEIHKIGEVL
jgi:hypothetical protein